VTEIGRQKKREREMREREDGGKTEDQKVVDEDAVRGQDITK